MPKRSLEAATTQIEEKATTVGITSTKDSKKKLKKKKKKKESPEIVEEVAASDLDELFGGLSRAKKQQQMDKLQNQREESGLDEARAKANANARAERNASGTISSLTMVQGKGDSKFDFQTPQVHRYTPDGLPVYKYFDLGMKQDDGGSGECPFDCSCCY